MGLGHSTKEVHICLTVYLNFLDYMGKVWLKRKKTVDAYCCVAALWKCVHAYNWIHMQIVNYYSYTPK